MSIGVLLLINLLNYMDRYVIFWILLLILYILFELCYDAWMCSAFFGCNYSVMVIQSCFLYGNIKMYILASC